MKPMGITITDIQQKVPKPNRRAAKKPNEDQGSDVEGFGAKGAIADSPRLKS
jgi:hypothetical protein